MNLKWSAKISMRTGGELVTYGIISFILIKNSYLRCLRNSTCFVQNRSNCNGLNCNWVLLLCIISWRRCIRSCVYFGNLPSLCFAINRSISFVYYWLETKVGFLRKKVSISLLSPFDESINLNYETLFYNSHLL